MWTSAGLLVLLAAASHTAASKYRKWIFKKKYRVKGILEKNPDNSIFLMGAQHHRGLGSRLTPEEWER